MSGGKSPPRIFVGSSVEGLPVAYAVQENLEHEAEVTVWSQGFFQPSKATLSRLLEQVVNFDFAVVVFSPDDVVRLRSRDFRTVRDNVVFELGLFYGRLGQDRCFFVAPREVVDFHLPTDLLGIEPLTYRADRSDGNLVAALGTAANQVRRGIRAVLAAPVVGQSRAKPELPSLKDFVEIWESAPLSQARTTVRTMEWGGYGPERNALAQVFAFLENVSDAVLSGRIDEEQTRQHFGQAIPSVWSVAHTGLAPLNHADEWWDPLPKIAQLAQRWRN